MRYYNNNFTLWSFTMDIKKQIIEEYLAERNEKFEDDKYWLMGRQGLNNISGFWRLIMLSYKAVFVMLVLFLLVGFLALDPDGIEAFRTASSEELVEVKGYIINSAIVIGAVVFSIQFLLSTFFGKSIIVNAKQQRLDEESQEAYEVSRIVDIAQELMFRHGVINKGDK